MIEKRRSIRRRTLLDGRIEIEKLNGWAVDCAVRNVGKGGARLSLPDQAIVPESFRLAISGGAPKPARLVWYRDGHAGVALLDRQADLPAGWDGTCRRASQPKVVAPAPRDNALQARIATIAARRVGDRRTAV